MSKISRTESQSISFWRENDVHDFLGMALLFGAFLAVTFVQQFNA